ncbi:hypothetical protein Q4601_00390 [Shewanella sp. 1_MG-2023]|uniref:DUF6795 domain-containing protein n=1 Tax=unclassified Shewanella TaxID=196818 RepID=UPI0026E158BA|nr:MULTISPECIES: DUF6795 domain-containing protein [unclassified Shewanella]MDO6610177.1 hypothetical protein [Shewanella sp. 7_MG-2023]MDO6769681.1 hypothetical protein [Shewanella sp. 2_MG-2023]MDO6792745.1 hypothetical protein [Shewanella sp. 1_MG-2023]
MFGLIKSFDVHMCSEVKGIVLLDGNPVVGAVINRNLEFAYKVEKEDVTVTDSEGQFYLPAINIKSKIPGDMFSHETTSQFITVTYDGETYVLWNSSLRGITELVEYKNKLASLDCDLLSSKVHFSFPNLTNRNLDFSGSGICHWETDFEIYEVDDGIDYFENF